MARSPSPWKALSLVSLIGVDLAVCTLIGYWIGTKADEWLGSSPLWLIVGVFVGMLAGILSLIPVIKKYSEDL